MPAKNTFVKAADEADILVVAAQMQFRIGRNCSQLKIALDIFFRMERHYPISNLHWLMPHRHLIGHVIDAT